MAGGWGDDFMKDTSFQKDRMNSVFPPKSSRINSGYTRSSGSAYVWEADYVQRPKGGVRCPATTCLNALKQGLPDSEHHCFS